MSRASTPRASTSPRSPRSPRSPQSSQQAPDPQQPQFIRIPGEALGDVRALEVLIDQHTRIVQALQRDLVAVISSSCRVNLDTEHWELDSRHGLLERRDDPPAAADQAAAAAVVPQE